MALTLFFFAFIYLLPILILDFSTMFKMYVNTSGESLVQDKKHIRVVAALIDTKTGHVVNAAKIDVSPFDASGINSIDTTNPLKVSYENLYSLKV